MTRAEAYSSGWHEGRRWAEEDIRDGIRIVPESSDDWMGGTWRAQVIGRRRGYRDTVARFEAGTLTPEMFENARVNR